MQQLTLFNNTSSRTLRHAANKKMRKNARQVQPNTNWELWSQTNESEKELALFFLDIRNFTPLAEKHQAFDVIHIVKKLFSTFQNIIRIHHGRIIETSGDGFYAAFGFDCNVKQAVNESVKAGMTILKTLEDLNAQSFEKNLHQRIDVGIGIHVGYVATGNLNIGSKNHLIVMGYPVNVASRLQAATKELNNNFIVSSEVFKQLDDPSLHHESVTTYLKGVTTPCELYLLGKSYLQER
jgi:adenylate cyclase